jgi:hypothetical protein
MSAPPPSPIATVEDVFKEWQRTKRFRVRNSPLGAGARTTEVRKICMTNTVAGLIEVGIQLNPTRQPRV